MAQLINLDAGEREYVNYWLTVTADHDITAATFQVGLGSYYNPPTVWLASSDPAVLSTRPTPESIKATLLIGNTILPAAGDAWFYLRVTDTGGEVLDEQGIQERVRIVNTGTVNYLRPSP